MTIKAARRLRECPVIAIPQEDKEHCVAYRIAVDAVPEIAEKKCLYLPMPMTKDAEILHKVMRMQPTRWQAVWKMGKMWH